MSWRIRFLFQFYDEVTPLPGSTAVRASIVDTARKYLDGLSKEAGNDQGLIWNWPRHISVWEPCRAEGG